MSGETVICACSTAASSSAAEGQDEARPTEVEGSGASRSERADGLARGLRLRQSPPEVLGLDQLANLDLTILEGRALEPLGRLVL